MGAGALRGAPGQVGYLFSSFFLCFLLAAGLLSVLQSMRMIQLAVCDGRNRPLAHLQAAWSFAQGMDLSVFMTRQCGRPPSGPLKMAEL